MSWLLWMEICLKLKDEMMLHRIRNARPILLFPPSQTLQIERENIYVQQQQPYSLELVILIRLLSVCSYLCLINSSLSYSNPTLPHTFSKFSCLVMWFWDFYLYMKYIWYQYSIVCISKCHLCNINKLLPSANMIDWNWRMCRSLSLSHCVPCKNHVKE